MSRNMSPNVSRKMSASFEWAGLQAAPQSSPMDCHPDRSVPSPKGMGRGVESLPRASAARRGGPPVFAKLNCSRGASTRTKSLATKFAAIALLTLTATISAPAQKPAGASLTADLPAGAMQAKATTACLECHEARIILQQRLTKAAWTKEVDKMTKWGAVVDPADRDALIDYLSANFSPDQPAYTPQRTSGKSGSGKTK